MQTNLGRRRREGLNPAEDLPADFEERRIEHYEKLSKPLDAGEFIEGLRAAMRAELDALHTALPHCPWLEIKERRQGAIKLTPLPKAPEPRNLRKLKSQVGNRWPAAPTATPRATSATCVAAT